MQWPMFPKKVLPAKRIGTIFFDFPIALNFMYARYKEKGGFATTFFLL
jgi:hypothetical protein